MNGCETYACKAGPSIWLFAHTLPQDYLGSSVRRGAKYDQMSGIALDRDRTFARGKNDLANLGGPGLVIHKGVVELDVLIYVSMQK